VERTDPTRGTKPPSDATSLEVRSKPEPAKGGDLITLGNEFAEVTLRKVRTHNGVRLEISAPRLGFTISLCPLELESLTWQRSEIFSEFLATPLGPSVHPTQP